MTKYCSGFMLSLQQQEKMFLKQLFNATFPTFHNHTTVLEGSKIWSDALLSSHNGKILKQY